MINKASGILFATTLLTGVTTIILIIARYILAAKYEFLGGPFPQVALSSLLICFALIVVFLTLMGKVCKDV